MKRPHVKISANSWRIPALVLAWCIAGCGAAQAQTRINLPGRDPELHVEFDWILEAFDQTESKLLYKRQDVPTKVTVHTFCPGQSFELFVQATSLTEGSPTGRIQLRDGMVPADFIVNVPRGTRMEQGTLLYTAFAMITQGNSDEEGLDTHVVTYTLVQQ